MNIWTSTALPLATLIIGALLAFLGQTHSRRGQERFEDARRWHDSKREAYARLLSACGAQSSSFSDALLRPEVLKHESGLAGKGWPPIFAANTALLSAFAEVRILGSPAVVQQGKRLLLAVTLMSNELIGFSKGDGHTEEEFLDHVYHAQLRLEALERIETNMLSEMRAELGTTPIGSDPALQEPWWPFFTDTQYSGPHHERSD